MVHYDAAGTMVYPTTAHRAPETALATYLIEAEAIFASHGEPDLETTQSLPGVSADFESLRWFDLPAMCLEA
jgi:hypothetical protein